MRRPWVPTELTARPFTTAQAGGYDVTPTALRSDPWVQMLRGVWRHRDLPDTRVPSGRRRARLDPKRQDLRLDRGLAVRHRGPGHPHQAGVWVACQTEQRMRSRPGPMMRELTLAPSDVMVLEGLPVTTPVRTPFDCARWLSQTEAAVVVDALGHDGLLCPDD